MHTLQWVLVHSGFHIGPVLSTFKCRLFQITNLMHNSFILQQYVCYITILNMFRAARCSSSGGQIVLLQPLVSSLSVNSRTVCHPSSGSTELCLTEITLSCSQIFFVCLVGVWQRNFEPAVCVHGTTGWKLVP